MSNLLKRGTTVSKTERVIDYNERIRNKLSVLMSQQENDRIDPDGFVNGLKADVVESLITDTDDAFMDNAGQDNADSQSAMSQQEVSELTAAALEDANQQAQQMLSEVQIQAEQIISDANKKAIEIQQAAQESGFQQGIAQAEQELQKHQDDLTHQFEQKQIELEKDYQEKKKEMEPELVNILLEVFEKVTKTVAEDNHDIILHLINSVMTNCELSKNFVIKVSTEDYKFVASNQGKIFCAMNTEVQIDIVEDPSMKKNECLIETDAGIFNCSLDIELKNLIKEIKLLSCL